MQILPINPCTVKLVQQSSAWLFVTTAQRQAAPTTGTETWQTGPARMQMLSAGPAVCFLGLSRAPVLHLQGLTISSRCSISARARQTQSCQQRVEVCARRSHQMTVVPHQATCILLLGLAVPVAMRLLGMHSDTAPHQLPKHCRHGSGALQRLRGQRMLYGKCWLLKD